MHPTFCKWIEAFRFEYRGAGKKQCCRAQSPAEATQKIIQPMMVLPRKFRETEPRLVVQAAAGGDAVTSIDSWCTDAAFPGGRSIGLKEWQGKGA